MTLSTHPDSEFFAETADQLEQGRLDTNQIEKLDELLNGYSVAVRMYLELHGQQTPSQSIEALKAA